MYELKGKPTNDGCIDCDVGPFTRNNYFTGKLLVERDFKDEQAYYAGKDALHNRQLHGCGVVCGLRVTQHESAEGDCRKRFVCIEPGTAIDCCGHEIIVPERECVDLTQFDAVKKLAANSNVPSTIENSHQLQICLRYRECPTEDIPVLYDDCGCDDTRCAPNRILESYSVDVLVDEPGEEPEKPPADCEDILWKHLKGCPDCKDGECKCIVLATIEHYAPGFSLLDVTVSPPNLADDFPIKVARIDNHKGRRLVPSAQTLLELIECVKENEPGGQGKPGPGIDSVDVTTAPCGQQPKPPYFKSNPPPQGRTLVLELPSPLDGIQVEVHANPCGTDATGKIIPDISNADQCKLVLDIPTGCRRIDLPHIVAINWQHGIPQASASLVTGEKGLLIAFDAQMQPDTINSDTFQVLYHSNDPQNSNPLVDCFCNRKGSVHPVRVVVEGSRDAAPGCDSVITFQQLNHGEYATGAQFIPEGNNWFPGEYRVIVKGDFILAATPDGEGVQRALDGDHLGPGLPLRCPTGDGVEGGTFESWFTIKQ